MFKIWITGRSEPPKFARLLRQHPGGPLIQRCSGFLLGVGDATTKKNIPSIGVCTNVSIYFLSAARGYTMTRRGLRSCVTADFRDAHRGQSVTRGDGSGESASHNFQGRAMPLGEVGASCSAKRITKESGA